MSLPKKLYSAVTFTLIGIVYIFSVPKVHTQALVSARPLKLFSSGSPINSITLQGPTTYSSTYTLTLPASAPALNQLLISDGSGALSWSQITNSHISSSAAIDYTKLSLANSIVAGDITSGAITLPKISSSGATTGQVISFDGTNVSWTTPTTSGAAGGDLTGTYPNPVIAASSVTSAKIADGTIVNADVSPTASIAYSKLALTNSIVAGDITSSAVTLPKISSSGATTGQVISFDGTNVSWTTPTTGGAAGGDLTGTYPNPVIAVSSVTSAKIVDATIVNADISGTAAIAYSKLNLAGTIVNADINSSAAITYSKLNLNNSLTGSDVASGTFTTTDAHIALGNNDNTAREIRFLEPSGSGVNYSAFKAQAQTANVTYTLPAADGSIGQALTTNGIGGLSWTSIIASGSSAGGDLSGSYPNPQIAAGAIMNADINGSAAIDYSKLNLSTSIVNADISASAAIAYSKLSLSNSIVAGDISSSAVTSAKIANNAVDGTKIALGSDANGDVMYYNGTDYVRLGIGSAGQVLTVSSGIPAWATSGSSLTNFSESVNTAAPNATIPVVRLLATNAATNVDVALSPKGTGALTAQTADNTTTGGNKRGQYSVDWQLQRSASSAVAAGNYNVIAGGQNNTTVQDYATVGGGVSNNNSGYGSTISGGRSNTASGNFVAIGGGHGNSLSNHYSAIPGGTGLTISSARSFGFHGNQDDGSGNSNRDMSISADRTAVFGNVDLWLANNDNTPRSLRFYEQYNTAGAYPSGTNYVGFKAANSIAADVIWTLPNADGTNGQVLSTNGSGILSWVTPTASGAAGGDLSGSYPNPQIAAGAIMNADINGSAAIDYSKLNLSNSIVAGDISSSAVTSAKIANNAVDGTKIALGSDANGDVMYYNGTDYVRLGIGSAGQVLTVSSGVPSWATPSGGSLSNFTESVNSAAPNATVPVVQLLATNAATDVDMALSPKGAGALTAQVADNTVTGGNKRGTNAVDWQMTRVANTQVASGTNATIGGGESNTASASHATVAGGSTNTASNDFSTIGGGGGNVASNIFATVGGGQSNEVSGSNATIAGGNSNSATAGYAFIGGGADNIASATYAAIGGGRDNVVDAAYSAIPGGRAGTLTAAATNSLLYNGNNAGGTRSISISAANTAVLNNVDLWLSNNDNTPRSLRFYEQYNSNGAFPSGTNYVGFKAPNSIASDVTWTLPDADGSTGQVLTTNGSGTLNWAAPTMTNTLPYSTINGGETISTTAVMVLVNDDGAATVPLVTLPTGTNGMYIIIGTVDTDGFDVTDGSTTFNFGPASTVKFVFMGGTWRTIP